MLRLKLASPCSADWDEMDGDDRKRFCHQCKLYVHNIAEYSEDEVKQMFSSGGRICGRLFQRRDGTVLTKDCPVGVARIRNRVVRVAAYAGALSLLLMCSTVLAAINAGNGGDVPFLTPLSRKLNELVGPRWTRALGGVLRITDDTH